MPNFKIFQDNAESAKVKVYADQSGTASSLNVDSNGYLLVTGSLDIASGDVITVTNTSGTALYVRPAEGASGAAWYVTQSQGTSGNAWFIQPTASGKFSVIGTDSGAPVFVTQVSGSSGNAWFIKQPSGEVLDIQIASRTTASTGPDAIVVSGSGTVSFGYEDVLGYNAWTLSVKNISGSGSVNVKLQYSAISGGSGGDWTDDAPYAELAVGSWQYLTTTNLARYVRLTCENTNTSDNTLNVYFQAQQ